MVPEFAVHDVLAWVLAVFSMAGAIGNCVARASVRAEYAR